MIKFIKDIYIKYKEIINYLIFGGLSTVVNLVSYYIAAEIIGIDKVLSSGISWFLAVLFAYITNKYFVFNEKENLEKQSKKGLLKEAISFFGARIVTGALCDIGTFALMINVLNIDSNISKLVTQVMVVILNYIFSKLIIFRKKDER